MEQLNREQLIDPNINDKIVSEVLYSGKWEYLQHLKENPKFSSIENSEWDYFANDKDNDIKFWTPLFFVFLLMGLNLLLKVFSQSYSIIMAVFSLGYLRFGIPILKNIKEKKRIDYLDKILEETPYHRSLYIEVEKEIEDKDESSKF